MGASALAAVVALVVLADRSDTPDAVDTADPATNPADPTDGNEPTDDDDDPDSSEATDDRNSTDSSTDGNDDNSSNDGNESTDNSSDSADSTDGTEPATQTDTNDDTGSDGAPDLPDRGVHPELQGIEGWLQSDVTSLEELRGKVVAVQFWTFGCSNCKATLPHMQALYERYRGDGLEIVGIHAPEFDYEADVDNIAQAATDLGVTWPIALDTSKRSFHHWQEGPRAYWPRIYLLDRDGHVRYDRRGEGGYDEVDAAVRTLLAEPA